MTTEPPQQSPLNAVLSTREASPFKGYVESGKAGYFYGWAFDVRTPSLPIRLHLLVDRQEAAQFVCNLSRPDVSESLGLPSANVGFNFALPEICFDHKPHEIGLRFPDRTILLLPDPQNDGRQVEALIFPGETGDDYRSYIDGIFKGWLRGWVCKRKTPYQTWRGKLTISVSVDGVALSTARADHYRGDVAEALGCDPSCGFEISLPLSLRDRQIHQFEVKVIPDNVALQNSPFRSSLVQDDLESRLVELEATIGSLHRQLTILRRDVRDLIPRRPYNLTNYDEWARRYQKILLEKTEQQRVLNPLSHQPLVSIICPVWRPLQEDFRTAIDSVIHQTYQNWELILVDDDSQCPQTHALMHSASLEDKRIKSFFQKENKGIAETTNAAIAQARGDYIAFFDHDDCLSPVALEVMVRAALESKAKLLYSDEDKIDPSGHYLEPNLKPDFNYRYLLGCNYICHFTMVDARTLRAVGPLEKRLDGAQDHDLILKLVEHLDSHFIFHVRDILYHWRKTPGSTASTLSSKAYAVNAGISAVQEHFGRQKIKGKVSSIDKLSIYKMGWTTRLQPSVSVIIPFRDQPEMTERCVNALLKNQNYKNLSLILVDNFSTETETLEFLQEIRTDPRVTLLRMEEKFNFSRLNNKAAQCSRSDYLFFLNNDVIIHQKDFIKTMIQEALSTPDVVIVGARLLYPNGTIQHAGVAVGPDVIGAHMHRMRPGHDYGYIGRICLSHEVTAVTGAAMLIRKDIFESVGGFDEKNLPVAYNDVDLCLKVRQKGGKVIYCADAIAEHFESFSRKSDTRPEHEERFFHEKEHIKERWKGNPLFENDPAYPRYFSEEGETFFDFRDLETNP